MQWNGPLRLTSMTRWTMSMSASGQPVRGDEACVVDEHVEAAERALDGFDRLGDGARVGDVGGDDEATAAGLLDRRRDFPGEVPALVAVHAHVRPAGGEGEGGGPADPARGSGDEGRLAVQEPLHRHPPR